MGLKIFGKVGTHIFFKLFFFLEKNTILCILAILPLPLKMHKIKFFPESMKKSLGFTSKRKGRVTLNTSTFLFGLTMNFVYV